MSDVQLDVLSAATARSINDISDKAGWLLPEPKIKLTKQLPWELRQWWGSGLYYIVGLLQVMIRPFFFLSDGFDTAVVCLIVCLTGSHFHPVHCLHRPFPQRSSIIF